MIFIRIAEGWGMFNLMSAMLKAKEEVALDEQRAVQREAAQARQIARLKLEKETRRQIELEAARQAERNRQRMKAITNKVLVSYDQHMKLIREQYTEQKRDYLAAEMKNIAPKPRVRFAATDTHVYPSTAASIAPEQCPPTPRHTPRSSSTSVSLTAVGNKKEGIHVVPIPTPVAEQESVIKSFLVPSLNRSQELFSLKKAAGRRAPLNQTLPKIPEGFELPSVSRKPG